jgi:hypothetical protein
MFALPLVIVAGPEGAGGAGVVPGTLADPSRLAAILREHRALAGNQTFALSMALVATEALDVTRLRHSWLPAACLMRLRPTHACRLMRFRRRRWKFAPARKPCTCASFRASRWPSRGPI